MCLLPGAAAHSRVYGRVAVFFQKGLVIVHVIYFGLLAGLSSHVGGPSV